MTCSVCGEKTLPGVVCCDVLMDELGNDVVLELARGELVVIRSGDVAVLQFDHVLSAADAATVRDMWDRFAPGTSVIILGRGARIAAVVRGTDDDESTIVPGDA